MKELSVEQKAKRYDELKVTAQELEQDGCFDKITLFDLFPELAESEDERIRKALIRFHKSTIDIDGIKGDEIIAWLEKQGEQKPALSEDEETMLKAVILNLEELKKHCAIPSTKYLSECINWLKTKFKDCKPQNTWKPSDEQLKALKEACDEHWESDGLDPLYILWEQLKKLRE